LAIREAAIMAVLAPSQIEDVFYNNAMGLFHGNRHSTENGHGFAKPVRFLY